ncbi:MAG: tetratricopeptide repeat protein, partial [Magnetococcales bacterium]|nr:tetratricopeptide repeat protein [Magnetococcales bacterium]
MSKYPIASQLFEEKLKIAINHYKCGDLQSAKAVYLELTDVKPEYSELHHMVGKIAFESKDYESAIKYLNKSLTLTPNNTNSLYYLAKSQFGKGDVGEAEVNFLKALKINPNLTVVLMALATIYIQQKKNDEAFGILSEIIKQDISSYSAHYHMAAILSKSNLIMMTRVHVTLFNHFCPDPKLKQELNESVDTFFVNPITAKNTADKANRIEFTVAVSGLQMCYYYGKPFKNPPKNLVNIDHDELITFFSSSRLRMPSTINFDPDNKEECAQAFRVASQFEELKLQLIEKDSQTKELCRTNKPQFIDGEPLKIFIPASRHTTVMQYCSRNLAVALKNKGCDVLFLIEKDETEMITSDIVNREIAKMVPHAVVNINHVANSWLHEDTYNITWWQDLMPKLIDGKPIVWRDRDLVVSAYPQFDPYLYRSGANKVYRQEFCVDLEPFSAKTPAKDRNKIVFIGNSYILSVENYGEAGKNIVTLLKKKTELGEVISDAYINDLSEKFSISYLDILEFLLPYVVRDTIIEWLCSVAPSLEYEVEIYGRWWDKNPIIAPYFRGELKHGEQVAKVYNEAKYAVAAIHRHIHSQRLVELAACGCIPVVFDQRMYSEAEPPYWDDECLYFNTKEELKDCFNR